MFSVGCAIVTYSNHFARAPLAFGAIYVAGGFDIDQGIINTGALPSHHLYVLSTLQPAYPGCVSVEGKGVMLTQGVFLWRAGDPGCVSVYVCGGRGDAVKGRF